MQSNLSYIFLISLFFCSFQAQSQDIQPKRKPIPRVQKNNLNLTKKDSANLRQKDTLILQKKDTIVTDTLQPKEAIAGMITHIAKDYTIQNAKNKTVTLYNEAHVTYTDIDL